MHIFLRTINGITYKGETNDLECDCLIVKNIEIKDNSFSFKKNDIETTGIYKGELKFSKSYLKWYYAW